MAGMAILEIVFIDGTERTDVDTHSMEVRYDLCLAPRCRLSVVVMRHDAISDTYFASLIETEIHYTYNDPVNDSRCRYQVLHP
jgi:hypothetical protein